MSESIAFVLGEAMEAVKAELLRPPGGEIACFFKESDEGFGVGSLLDFTLRPSRGIEWGVSDMLGRTEDENDARGGIFGITRGEGEGF
jgi:hypothetical protein